MEIACDTDSLGTFSGEIERKESALRTAELKARMGMEVSKSKFGIANEGSFGPHPFIPFISADTEVMIFIDDNLGIKIHEMLIEPRNNFSQEFFGSLDQAKNFLEKINFPSHGVVVRAGKWEDGKFLKKGVIDKFELESAFKIAKEQSADSMVLIESDMRAHVNPTRMAVIRKLAIKLALRISQSCPKCDSPGFGKIGSNSGLPCEYCNSPTELKKEEIFGCISCKYEESHKLNTGDFASPFYCQNCNP